MRTKAEELRLRRAQLERRRARLGSPRLASPRISTPGGTNPPIVEPPTEMEDMQRVAMEETRLEKLARAAADRRSNEMALRALEAERMKRLEAEKLLAIERASGAKLLSRVYVQDQRKHRRQRAAARIQTAWRGYWVRLCLNAGREVLVKHALVMQACYRGLKARKAATIQKREEMARRHMDDYLKSRAEGLLALPANSQPSFVVEAGATGLSVCLSAGLVVEHVEAGGPADTSGVRIGMRLVSFQGVSTLELTSDETRRQMSGTPRPWTLVFDNVELGAGNTRTIFELVQQIKHEIGLEQSLGVEGAITEACEQLHIKKANSIPEMVWSACRELEIDIWVSPIVDEEEE